MDDTVGQGPSGQGKTKVSFVVQHVLGLALDESPRHVQLGTTAPLANSQAGGRYSLDPLAVHLVHRFDSLTVRRHEDESTEVRGKRLARRDHVPTTAEPVQLRQEDRVLNNAEVDEQVLELDSNDGERCFRGPDSLGEIKRKVENIEIARKSGRLFLAGEEGALERLESERALRVGRQHEGSRGSRGATSGAAELGKDIPGHLGRRGERLLRNSAIDSAAVHQPRRQRAQEEGHSHAVGSEDIAKLKQLVDLCLACDPHLCPLEGPLRLGVKEDASDSDISSSAEHEEV